MNNTKTYIQLPDLDTLIEQRRTHTLKQLADLPPVVHGGLYGIPPSTLFNRLARAEALMHETKRLAWAAWDDKVARRGQKQRKVK